MNPVLFGAWEVNENGIRLILDGQEEFIVERDLILNKRQQMFDWPLRVAMLEGLGLSDITMFNYAFFYALGVYKLRVPTDISVDSTINEQLRLIGTRTDLNKDALETSVFENVDEALEDD